MNRISKNNLSIELQNELKRLSTIGDLIGGVDTFDHLPTVNNGIGGTGVSIIGEVTQIKSHDLIIVSDALADSKGRNAIYEASTSINTGDSVSWTFVMNMIVPIPKRIEVLSTTVPAIVGNTADAISDEVYNIFTADPEAVEVFVNGIYETDFTISSETKKLSLTGYPTEGWTASDKVEVFVWKVV